MYDRLRALAQQYRQVKQTQAPGLRLEYGVMMCIGAAQAIAMGARTATVIEFGVYKGDGFGALIDMAEHITSLTGLQFRLFGFDTGAGMPPLHDYRDHPEIWSEGIFADLDFDQLRAKLPSHAHLVIGNMADTVPEFCRSRLTKEAPISFVAVDSDLYHSAVTALTLFEQAPEFFVPATPVYFDDVDDIITYNARCGEALAIDEFNRRNVMRFFERKRRDMHGYYTCQILDHPIRNRTFGPHGSFDIRVNEF